MRTQWRRVLRAGRKVGQMLVRPAKLRTRTGRSTNARLAPTPASPESHHRLKEASAPNHLQCKAALFSLAKETREIADWEALRLYGKLGYYLGITTDCAHLHKATENGLYHDHPPGFHRVAWLPKLTSHWRRLSLKEFLTYYNLTVCHHVEEGQ
jgi:hypothetical protein